MFVLSKHTPTSTKHTHLNVSPPLPFLHLPQLPASSASKQQAGLYLPTSEKSRQASKGKCYFRCLIRPRTRMEAGTLVRPGEAVRINTQVTVSRYQGLLAGGSRQPETPRQQKGDPLGWYCKNHTYRGYGSQRCVLRGQVPQLSIRSFSFLHPLIPPEKGEVRAIILFRLEM